MNLGLTSNPTQSVRLLLKPADDSIRATAGVKKDGVRKIAARDNGVNLNKLVKIVIVDIH